MIGFPRESEREERSTTMREHKIGRESEEPVEEVVVVVVAVVQELLSGNLNLCSAQNSCMHRVGHRLRGPSYHRWMVTIVFD